MEPAAETPQGCSTEIQVYQGSELVRMLKQVRGVACYSGHKNTPANQAMRKLQNSISKFKESEIAERDPEQTKKVLLLVFIFGLLVYFILDI